MTDLLQMNGNDLNNPLAPTTPKTTICPAAQLHTKRPSTATVATTKSTKSNNQTTGNPNNSNHKRPSTVDTNAHKRLKCSTDTTVRMIHATHPAPTTTSTPPSINFYPQSYQLQKQQTAPHLLQHLMAPTPRARKFNEMGSRGNGTGTNINGTDAMQQQQQRWNGSDDDGQQSGMYQQMQNGDELNKSAECQSSNSVLKNLLVSGCDISAGYICAVPIRAKKAAKA